MVKEAMNEAGIEIEKFTELEAPPHHPELCDPTALFHTYGRKSCNEQKSNIQFHILHVI